MIYALLDKQIANDNDGYCRMTALAAMNTFIETLRMFGQLPNINQMTNEEFLACQIAALELTRDEAFNERV